MVKKNNKGKAATGADSAIDRQDGLASSARATRDANSYSRRILLVVVGLTPQVVTETLYALTQNSAPFMPTELWVATTGAGRRQVERYLLDSGADQVGKLCREYEIPPMTFGETNVLSLTDSSGRALDDAHEQEAFLALGDLITSRLAQWTAENDTAVHLSLAGGRKSMGYIAGHALSLLGRPQDTLSHVLVESPFERLQDFFYPPKKSKPMRFSVLDEDGHPTGESQFVDPAKAKVQLEQVPYLRLREILSPVLLSQAQGLPFRTMIDLAQRSLEPPLMELSCRTLNLTCAGIAVHLAEENFAFLLALAKSGTEGIDPKAADDSWVWTYIDCYELVVPGGRESHLPDGSRHGVVQNKVNQFFDRAAGGALVAAAERAPAAAKRLRRSRGKEFWEMHSRTNKALDKALGPYLASRYQVAGLRKAGAYRFSEDLEVKVDWTPRKEL